VPTIHWMHSAKGAKIGEMTHEETQALKATLLKDMEAEIGALVTGRPAELLDRRLDVQSAAA